jgi:uncharacterized caspase-like protein
MPRALSTCFRGLLLGAVAVFLALATTHANAERRVALVIGNSSYKHAGVLENAAGDAGAIAELLRKINFDVTEGTDLGREALVSHLQTFAQKAEGADAALLFYAGHAIAVAGKNHLVPVDAAIRSEIDLKLATLDVDQLVDQTMLDAKVKILLLDISRANPFPSGKQSRPAAAGLPDTRMPSNSITLFATLPGGIAIDGKPGERSPFTSALLDHIAAPGVAIRQALLKVLAEVQAATDRKQIPWLHTNMEADFYMNPLPDAQKQGNASAPGNTTAAAPLETNNAETEIELWRLARESRDAKALNAYLARFPNGVFADIARIRIAELQAQAAAPKPVAPAPKPVAPAPKARPGRN